MSLVQLGIYFSELNEINKENVATVDNVLFLDDLRAKLRSKLENICFFFVDDGRIELGQWLLALSSFV